jgi:hypothetical protein
MIYTREEIFSRVQTMVSTISNKDINSAEVIECTGAIVDLFYQNLQAGLDQAFKNTVEHFGLEQKIEPAR